MIVFLNELEHGIRVSALGSNGQPVPGISSTAHAFCNSGNSRWISINIAARLLEEGRIVKSLRQVEKCILIAQSTGFPDMARVLFGLSETSLVGFGSLLFHPYQDATLLPLRVPIGAPRVQVVFIAGRVDQCQCVMSQGIALAGCSIQTVQQDRAEPALVGRIE